MSTLQGQTASRLIRHQHDGPDPDYLQQLQEYIEQFAVEAGSRFRPVSPEQIRQLADISKTELPAEYSRFLQKMGNGQGELFDDLHALFDIDTVLDLHSELKQVPDGYLVIGRGEMDIDLPEFSLKLDEPGRGEVYLTDEDEVIDCYSGSLAHFLFQQAFFRYELAAFPYRSYLGMDMKPKPAAPVLDCLNRFGTAYWFSDEQNYCAATAQGAIALHCYRRNEEMVGGWITLGSVSRDELADMENSVMVTAVHEHAIRKHYFADEPWIRKSMNSGSES